MRARVSLLFVVLIILLFFFIFPNQTVWGGASYQTVPTIGPTATPSATFTATVTNSATTIVSTSTTQIVLPTKPQATVAITLITPAVNNSATPGFQETDVIDSATSMPAKPSSSTETVQPTEFGTAVVQNQTNNQNASPAESQNRDNSEIKNLPPQWLFPLIGAALLVILFLIIKWIFRMRNHN